MSASPHVIPAKAGTQGSQVNAQRALISEALDPRLRGDDVDEQRANVGAT